MHLSQGQAWPSALDVANLWTSSFAVIPAQSLLIDFHNEEDFSHVVCCYCQHQLAAEPSCPTVLSSEVYMQGEKVDLVHKVMHTITR
jgi:hypothetical protein